MPNGKTKRPGTFTVEKSASGAAPETESKIEVGATFAHPIQKARTRVTALNKTC
jgi:hypothetical protein